MLPHGPFPSQPNLLILTATICAPPACPAAAGATGCQPRLLLVYEVFAEERATALYPVNALRNYARLLADTPLVGDILRPTQTHDSFVKYEWHIMTSASAPLLSISSVLVLSHAAYLAPLP